MWAGLVLLLATGGCQSGRYRASKLPPELCSPPSLNSEEVNLSSISGSNYNSALIAPGDLLEVTIVTGIESEKQIPLKTRVAENGSITLPMVGPVPVAGLEAFEASKNVESLAVNRGIYRRPQANVEIVQKAVYRVTVLGKVNEPGTHELPRGSTDLLTALAAAGGLSEEAGTLVEIRRQSQHAVADAGSDNGDAPAGDVQLAWTALGRSARVAAVSIDSSAWWFVAGCAANQPRRSQRYVAARSATGRWRRGACFPASRTDDLRRRVGPRPR
jgi:polysaccharide export outer membrane protein